MSESIHSQIPPEASATEPVFPERRRRTRRKGNGVSHYSHRRRTRLIYGLGIGAFILFLALVSVSIQLGRYARKVDEMALRQRKQERELSRLRPRITELEGEIAELVKGRLPGLHPLEFDKVIPIRTDYVRHLLFTLIGKEKERGYEYRLTMQNNNLTPIHPRLRILFFDQLGIQVASSVVGADEDGTPTVEMLERGEVRSYTGVIRPRDGKEAKYFKIEVESLAHP